MAAKAATAKDRRKPMRYSILVLLRHLQAREKSATISLATTTSFELNRATCDQNQEHYLATATICGPRNSFTMAVAIARAARALGCRSQVRRHDESISTNT